MTAIKWDNGMVMVFDKATGQQVYDMQGPYDEVREKCLRRCDKFQHGTWVTRTVVDVPKEVW